jgi:hypothetical protein
VPASSEPEAEPDAWPHVRLNEPTRSSDAIVAVGYLVDRADDAYLLPVLASGEMRGGREGHLADGVTSK